MASLVRTHIHPAINQIMIISSPSPSSTASVTRKRSTTRSDLASADVTKFSEVRRRLSDEEPFYSYTYHTGRNESLAVQEIPRWIK